MNILRMAPTVRTLQSKIGYEFRNAQYLWEAVQAPGSIIRDGEVTGAGTERHSIGFQRFPDGNRRLAILGDAVLRVVIVDDWYKGTAVRERLNRIASDLGSNANLDVVGRKNGLGVLINKNPAQYESSVELHTMAATVEAILGAVYLDSGMKSVQGVMHNLGLMPRLVRATIPKLVRKTLVPPLISEIRDAASVSTSNVEDQGESEMAPTDSYDRLENALENAMRSSQELEEALQEDSIGVQLKQRLV